MNARLIGLAASFAAITMLIGAQSSYTQELPAPPEPERLPTVTPQARVPVPVSGAIANSATLPLDLQQIVDLVQAETAEFNRA